MVIGLRRFCGKLWHMDRWQIIGKSGDSFILWRTFYWYGLGPCVPLVGKVTANQHKVILTGHLYPMMKYFCPSRMTPPSSTGHKVSLNVCRYSSSCFSKTALKIQFSLRRAYMLTHIWESVSLSLTRSHLQSSLLQTLIEMMRADYLWGFRSVLPSTAHVRVKWKCWFSLWHSTGSQISHSSSGLSDSRWERDYFCHSR